MLKFFESELEMDTFLFVNKNKPAFRMAVNPKSGKLCIFWAGKLQLVKSIKGE